MEHLLITSGLLVGYKVANGSRVFSPATISALHSIRYRLNQWTTRDPENHGAFAVFKTYEQALDFMGYVDATNILKVLYRPSNSFFLWKKRQPAYRKSPYGTGYYREVNCRKEKHINTCPDGTALADAIYVDKIVYAREKR